MILFSTYLGLMLFGSMGPFFGCLCGRVDSPGDDRAGGGEKEKEKKKEKKKERIKEKRYNKRYKIGGFNVE